MTLQQDRLTVEGRSHQVFPVVDVQAVKLGSRRLYEAVPVAIGFVSAAALAHNLALRMLFAVLAFASVAAVFAYRRLSVTVVRRPSASSKAPALAASVWTLARSGSADADRIAGAFDQFHHRLSGRGVEVLQ